MDQSRTILIISYFFYPESTPRAFRTYELVKEFIARGYSVDLVLPRKQVYLDAPVVMDNLSIRYLGNQTDYQKTTLSGTLKRDSLIRNWGRFFYRFFNPFTNTRAYIHLLQEELSRVQTHYHMLISISYPIVCHIGTARAMRKNPRLRNISVKVAEYSDPFYVRKGARMFFLYKYLDRRVAKSFDFIAVPTEKAAAAYLKHKPRELIRVIPQGFNFEDIRTESYRKNEVPTFAYAGVFYKKIRNPSGLFKFLEEAEFEYKFYLFTSKSNTDSMDFVNLYQQKLGNKLIVRFNVERLELIRILSTMDFLININNTSQFQSPSKLIDYALAKRPVFNFDQVNFDENKFKDFIDQKYDSMPFDLGPYDIKNVARQFLELHPEEPENVNAQ